MYVSMCTCTCMCGAVTCVSSLLLKVCVCMYVYVCVHVLVYVGLPHVHSLLLLWAALDSNNPEGVCSLFAGIGIPPIEYGKVIYNAHTNIHTYIHQAFLPGLEFRPSSMEKS